MWVLVNTVHLWLISCALFVFSASNSLFGMLIVLTSKTNPLSLMYSIFFSSLERNLRGK